MLIGGWLIVGVWVMGYEVIVEIVDIGLGIVLEMLSRIYDLFFMIKVLGQGIGLGFLVIYGVV